MADLGSAPIPALDPAIDHIRGRVGPGLVLVYTDFECPFCAALQAALHGRERSLAVRHFPVRSSHPRAWAAACAAEAAAAQGRFWEMHDALFSDPSRLEDPHLWERARTLGLELAQFDADRRSGAVIARVTRDFRSGVRAGVVTTPAAFGLRGDGTFAAIARDSL
jgi:protein-disulfide isomerase